MKDKSLDRGVFWVCIKSAGAHRYAEIPLAEGRPKCMVKDCGGTHFRREDEFDRQNKLRKGAVHAA